MDNQHRKIKGYRELTQAEIDLMNKIKEKAAEVGELVAELEDWGGGSPAEPRWVQLGRDDLQKGFMSLTRSIAKPDFF